MVAAAAVLATVAAGCGGGTTTVEKTVTVGVVPPAPTLVLARRNPRSRGSSRVPTGRARVAARASGAVG